MPSKPRSSGSSESPPTIAEPLVLVAAEGSVEACMMIDVENRPRLS